MSLEKQEVAYSPPDYRTIPRLLQNLCDFINEGESKFYWHPIVKASLLHYAIGYIHPFVDGNGRTARSLFYWYLIKNKYSLMEHLAISKFMKDAPSQYSRAYIYSEYDNNDVTYFVNFNLKTLKRAINKFEEYLKMQQKKINEIQQLRASKNLNWRQADLLVYLKNHPASLITLKWIQERFGVSYQTARTDVFTLAKKGLLKAQKIQNLWLFSLNK